MNTPDTPDTPSKILCDKLLVFTVQHKLKKDVKNNIIYKQSLCHPLLYEPYYEKQTMKKQTMKKQTKIILKLMSFKNF